MCSDFLEYNLDALRERFPLASEQQIAAALAAVDNQPLVLMSLAYSPLATAVAGLLANSMRDVEWCHEELTAPEQATVSAHTLSALRALTELLNCSVVPAVLAIVHKHVASWPCDTTSRMARTIAWAVLSGGVTPYLSVNGGGDPVVVTIPDSEDREVLTEIEREPATLTELADSLLNLDAYVAEMLRRRDAEATRG